MLRKFAHALMLLTLLCGSCADAYTLSGDTYIIFTDSDFRALMTNTEITTAGKYFLLSCDIQLADCSNWAGIGTKDNPFNGHFDGQEHTIYVNISPLPVLADTYTPIIADRGLFGYVHTESEYAVKNLKVEGSVNGYNSGGIVSVLEAGTIENCSFYGDVTAETREGDTLIYVLIDELDDDDVQDVDDVERFDDAVTNKTEHRRKINAGGIVGVIEAGRVINCTSRGNITAAANFTPANAGGIAGKMFDGNITGCYVDGDSVITAYVAEAADNVFASAGGIIGFLEASGVAVENNTSYAEISGKAEYLGGIVGALGNDTYSGEAIGEGNVYSGADYGIGRDEWGKPSDGEDAVYYTASSLDESSEGAVTIKTTALNSGTQGEYYRAYLYASSNLSGGTMSWEIIDGDLPSGLELSTLDSMYYYENGRITGTPTVSGLFSFTIRAILTVSDKTYYATQELNLYIAPTPALVISTDEELPEATLRRSYSADLTAYTTGTGNAVAARWTLTDGAFPEGLALDRTSGRISGTPSESGEFTFTLTATYGTLTAEKTFTLYVSDADFRITAGSLLKPGIVGTDYGDEALTTDAPSSLGERNWYVYSGSLPSGLTLGRNTGIISGTPTEAGTFTFGVRLLIGDQIAAKSFTITIIPGEAKADFSIITDALPPGIVGEDYAQFLSADAPASPDVRVWYIDAGNLPSGLTLGRNTGIISGTPTEAGTFTFTVKLFNGEKVAAKSFTITIIPGEAEAGITITTDALPPGVEGRDYSQALLTDAPLSLGSRIWYIDEGTLPPGLTLSRSNGILSGTPTAEGTYTFRVRLLAGSQITAHTFTLLIIPGLAIDTEELPNGKEGINYTYALTTSADYVVWTISEGKLPLGLSMSSEGVISGTPTRAGDYTFTVHAEDRTEGLKASRTLTITILPEFSIITDAALPRTKIGQWYSVNLSADIDASYLVNWSILDGALPPGLQLNGANGNIAGTPQRDGAYTFTVQAAAGNYIAAKTFGLIVGSVLEIVTPSELPQGKAKQPYSCNISADTEFPVLWSLTEGDIPDGLTFSDGTFSGTPAKQGTYTFTLCAESGGLSADKTFTLTITSALTIITPSVLPAAKLGADYSYTLSSDAPEGSEVLWSQVLSSLYVLTDDESVYTRHYDFPEGMYIEETTGLIYGVPDSEEGVYRIRIQAVMGDVSTTKDFTLTVRPTLSITTDNVLPHALTHEVYSVSLLTDADEDQVVTWAVADGMELPESLMLDEQTGIISGYPLNEGTYRFTVNAMMNGLTAQKEFELTAGKTMIILTPQIPDVLKAGESFDLTLRTDIDSDARSSWAVIEGIIPPGLKLDALTGRIYGSPSRAGTYTFTVQNITGYSVAEKELTLTVDFVISGGSLISWKAGEYDSYKFSAEGVSSRAVLWATSGDVLPTGLSMSREGLLSGTTYETGTYTFAVYAFVSNDVSAMKSVKLKVSTSSQIAIVTAILPDGVVSEDYYAELEARAEGAVWSMEDGRLPPGLTLYGNGVISGTPEEAGKFIFVVKAAAEESEGIKELSITITTPEEKADTSSGGGGGCDTVFCPAMFALIVPLLRRRGSVFFARIS